MENLILSLDKIKNDKTCNLWSPLEGFTSQFKLSKDLLKFYELCNGVK